MKREDAERLSDSLRDPQLEPSDHAYVVLQDFGPDAGGWGPAAVKLPWMEQPRPFVYTGEAEHVLEVVSELCRSMAQTTGKPTRLVRYSLRDDVFIVGGAS